MCRSTSRFVHPGQEMRDRVAPVLLRPERNRAGKVRDDLVGDDDGDRDRDERLAQVLALVPAQQELLHGEPEHGDARHRDEPRHHPLPRVHILSGQEDPGARHPLLHLVGDVATEEVEGAVGHVHDAHEPEDEREPARDDEQQPGEREAVEDGLEERARVVQRGSRVGRPPVAPHLRRRVRDHEDVEEREHDNGDRGAARHGPDDSPGADSLGHQRDRTYQRRTALSTGIRRALIARGHSA